MNNVKVPNVKVPNIKAPSAFMENLQVGLVILVFLLFVGVIIFCIYKLMNAAGIKPASKNSKEQCSVDIECKSNMCRFAMCV
jgi:hypothetical protein